MAVPVLVRRSAVAARDVPAGGEAGSEFHTYVPELGDLVNAIVDAVENPDDRPLCKRHPG